MKYLVLLFLILSSCSDADVKVGMLRPFVLPSTSVVAEKYYTNTKAVSPVFSFKNYSSKYEFLLSEFQYRVYKDDIPLTEWISAGRNYEFSMSYPSMDDQGIYVGKVRVVTIYGEVTNLPDVSWYLDTQTVNILSLINYPTSDLTKTVGILAVCIGCDDLTLVKAELTENQGEVVLQTITAKADQVIQFENINPLRMYIIKMKLIDRANNISSPVSFGYWTCTNEQIQSMECY